MRYFPQKAKVHYDYADDNGMERTYVRQPSLVDSFYFQENKCSETGETTHQFSHPLYMLFNQERIDRLGDGAVQQWLKSLERASTTANELKSKISDSDLLAMVKSRHIQHPCELERYMQAFRQLYCSSIPTALV